MKKLFLAFFCLSTMILAKEVTVSILPQKYFVKKIAGDKIDVNVMVKPGSSPAMYEPKVSQMRKLSKSLVYFSIGVPFENAWLEKFKNANKKMLIVDTAMGIQKISMLAHSHDHEEEHGHKHVKHENHEYHQQKVHHEHEKHEEHEHHEHQGHGHHEHHKPEHHEHQGHGHHHGGLDPHIWLSPLLVKVQARNIYSSLVKIDPENKDFYKKNLNTFLKEIKVLDKKIEDILTAYKNKPFMVFHPSWGYFSLRYNLEQIAIEVNGKEPKPAQLINLVKEAKLHDIKIVFVAPQFSQKGAKTISKSINANVVIIDPLDINWDENLIKVAKEIANSYK